MTTQKRPHAYLYIENSIYEPQGNENAMKHKKMYL